MSSQPDETAVPEPSGPDRPAQEVSDEHESPAADDASLGGYIEAHDRPPAFEGEDGHPYTVSIESEKTGDLVAPFRGFLVFPKWAKTGVGIVGHLETGTLCTGSSREDVRRQIGAYPLLRVKRLLDEAIHGNED